MSTSTPRTVFTIIAILLASCSNPAESEDPSPSDATVTATTAQRFTPATVDIPIGGTVTWRFESLGHNVTFTAVAGAPADISGVNANTSISRSFAAPGTFAYHCTIHPTMTGDVRVATAAPPTPPPASPPPPPPGY